MTKIKKALLGGIIAAVSFISVGCGNTPEPGQTILKVYKSGDEAGFEKATPITGSYNQEWNAVYYSISNRLSSYVYTSSMTEGKSVDESIKFRTSDSFVVSVNVGISYSITNPKLFLSVHKMEDELLVGGPLYTVLRDRINSIGNTYSLNDLVNIPGNPKPVNTAKALADFQANALAQVNKKTQAYGVTVHELTLVNGFTPPTEISAQILNSQKEIIEIQKLTSVSTAKAAQFENELKSANAKLQLSKIEAQARQLESAGLTQEYIILEAVKKWNGDLTLVRMDNK